MLSFEEVRVEQQLLSPGSWGRVVGKVVNTGTDEVLVDEIRVEFDWGMYWYQKYGMKMPPGALHYFSVGFRAPDEVLGTYSFRVGAGEQYPSNYRSWQVPYAEQSGMWTEPVLSLTPNLGQVCIKPFPIYSAFVSRSVSKSDAPTVDPIVAMIEDWGFTPHTIGVDIVADYPNLPFQVRNAIRANDCLVVIATKRDLSAISGRWKTFEWSHGETGIGFDAEKPILVISDYEVQLGGLPAALPPPQIMFDANNMQGVAREFSRVLPDFRKQIAAKKHNEFWEGVAKVAVPIGAFVLGAALASKAK